jgi:hypothetical protein
MKPDTILKDKKLKVTYFLLDYDNTAAYLFPEAIESNPTTQKHLKTDKNQQLLFTIRATRAVLESFLNKKAAGADVVELGIGSTRQTRQHDEQVNSKYCLTGSCFRLYADLARRKNWYFNKILLGDFEDSNGMLRQSFLPLGTTMGPLDLDELGNHRYVCDSFADSAQSSSDKNKSRLLLRHVNYIKTKYPSAFYDVELVFVDDNLPIILNPLAEYVAREMLPQPIQIEFIHFNCGQQFLTLKQSDKRDEDAITKKAKKLIYTHSIYRKIATIPTTDLGNNSVNLTGTNLESIRQSHTFFKSKVTQPDESNIELTDKPTNNSSHGYSFFSLYKTPLTLLVVSISAFVITRHLLGNHTQLEQVPTLRAAI